jgi:tRNA-Thr(GGU) m(6)t(6)A37 methyltransferase TsaA
MRRGGAAFRHSVRNGPVSGHEQYEVRPVGHVESTLVDPSAAPNQGDEGAPEAWLVFDPEYTDAVRGIEPGADVLVLTWLDRARRDVLAVHPRGDESRPLTGVFGTRSPHRPNPIGLHRVRVTSVDGLRVRVAPLEAVHGTPILDVKPLLRCQGER